MLLAFITLFGILNIQSSERMISNVEVFEHAIKDAISNAIAPAINSMTERQDAIEARTTKQFEQLQGLLDSLSVTAGVCNDNRSSTPIQLPCHICSQPFSNLENLDKHIESSHPSLHCSECGKVLRSIPDLNYHIHKNHVAQNIISSNYSILNDVLPDDISLCMFSPPPTHASSPSSTFCRQRDHMSMSQENIRHHSVVYHSELQAKETPFTHPYPSLHTVTGTECSVGSAPDSDSMLQIHCFYCPRTFSSMRNLNVHTATVHAEKLALMNNTTSTIDLSSGATSSSEYHCSSCEESFCNNDELRKHLASKHNTSSFYSCNMCTDMYPSLTSFIDHLHSAHDIVNAAPCWKCDKIFLNNTELASHRAATHVEACANHCHVCDKSFENDAQLHLHLQTDHVDSCLTSTSNLQCFECDEPFPNQAVHHNQVITDHRNIEPAPLSPILQMDENVSLVDDSSASSLSRTLGGTSPSCDFTYNYSLNPQNQARRMLSNALKPPITVTYNNIQSFNSVPHALNAIIECSSGVYLTAIKPALQKVTDSWSADVGNHLITCSKVSDRNDQNNRHLLCTVLNLHIKPKTMQYHDTIHNLTLHFYHTKDKVLVQGSSLLPPGISAAKWFVKCFIEPLAENHIAINQHSINQVNSAIISSASSSVSSQRWSCSSCRCIIDPAATQVKDLPLSCDKCNTLCHKKCSDRSGERGSKWNKKPWLCPACLTSSDQTLGTNVQQSVSPAPGSVRHPAQIQSSLLSLVPALPPGTGHDNAEQQPEQEVHRPSDPDPVAGRQPSPVSPPEPTTAGLSPPTPTSGASPTPLLEDDSILSIQRSRTVLPPQNLTTSAQVCVTSFSNNPNQATQQRRYPNNSIRQRGSNVATTDPEKEFLKTTIDACRSTIVQQEADIKRLNESMDIKNKRIMQLESQVGVATEYLSNSNTTASSSQQSSSTSTEHLNNLIESIRVLLGKLSSLPDLFSKTQTVNVYNNQRLPTSEKSSQTAATVFHKNDDHIVVNTRESLTEHNDHLMTDELQVISENILTCTLCNITLQSSAQLNDHLESNHDNNKPSDVELRNDMPCSSTSISTESSTASNPQSL